MEKQINLLYKPLFLYIKKRINNEQDAEDLTQEVFYKLAKANNDKVISIKNWVYTIAKNSIIDYYRKKKYVTEELENMVPEDKHIEDAAANELSKCIVPFIKKIPKDYRHIVSLCEIENLSQKEIAERLNMNPATVRSKILRGRLKLKNLISACCAVTQGGKGRIVDFEMDENCIKNC